jgi:hypothetical protein
LDFFGLEREAVCRLVPAVEEALQVAGLVVHRIQVNPGFARLAVESADDRTDLDLAADARLFPAERGWPAPMPSGEELAVDKLLALFGRPRRVISSTCCCSREPAARARTTHRRGRPRIRFRVLPKRNWLSLWKPAIDALGGVRGEGHRDWHPRDDRISLLVLERELTPDLGWEIELAASWAAG